MPSILMDVDTGIDDALALVYLLSRPEVRIEAITCTAGNVGARQVALNNLALLELCGRAGIEVAVGAEVPLEIPLVTTEETHGPQGIGHAELPPPKQEISPRHAVDVWVEAARVRPGEITGLITGPLTNFALALRAEPGLPKLLKGLVIMGGCFNYQGNTTPTAEWNVSVDPHAAAEVFAAYSGLPEDKLPVVCALETTERIELRPEHLQRLAEAAGAEPELVLPNSRKAAQRLGQPARGVPLGCHPLLHGVPPALRPGVHRAHARRVRSSCGHRTHPVRHAAGHRARRNGIAPPGQDHRGRLPGHLEGAVQCQGRHLERSRAVLRRTDLLGGQAGHGSGAAAPLTGAWLAAPPGR
jgi:inosine-uridine nucleoside N-ribohydrolase